MMKHACLGLAFVSACTFDSQGLGQEGTTTLVADSTSTSPGPSPSPSTGASTTSSGATFGTTTTQSETTALDSSSSGSSESSSGEAGCETSTRWWDGDWSRRRLLTIDASSVTEALASVPIRVRLDSTRVDYAAVQEGGEDLRFLDEDRSTELEYEVERWDESGDSEIWLRLPLVPAGSMLTVSMYYGNAAASPGEDPAAVWDSGFVSVHHLASMSDATEQGHDGFGPNLPGDAQGRIGRGRFFDGVDDQIELPQEPDFDFDTALTVEAWAEVSSFTTGWQALVTKGDGTWRMHRSGGSRAVGFGSNSMTQLDNLGGTTPIDDGQWHHLAIVYGADLKSVYVDGQLETSRSFTGPLVDTAAVVLFGNNANHLERSFHGTMDEIRISNVERSAAWIDLQVRAMQDAGIVSFGPEQTCP